MHHYRRGLEALLISLFVLLFTSTVVRCQDGLDIGETNTENAGTDGKLGEQDPNLINPQNRQGYGREIPQQVMETKPLKVDEKKEIKKTIAEQTIQAVLQFGVLVAVAFMVGFLFILTIGVEIAYDKVKQTLSSLFCSRRSQVIDEPDPADLVGTFKRYK